MIGKEPIDFFKLFFTDVTFDEILVETNRYGDQYVDSHQEHLAAHKRARAHNFIQKCFSIGELYKFIALILTMGIVSLPKIPHYWSTKWPFFSTNFSPVMKRDRFQLLLKMLHLANNSSMIPHGQPRHDKLFKLRPLLDSLVERFKLMYQPNRELAVDESMIGFKGRLSFLQYIPNKPHKWGLKAWVLADSRTGYVCNWKLYTGKEAGDRSQYGLAEKVVLDLTSHLSNSGHHLYTDNFYTSPILCKRLLEIGFGSCGTARSNRRGIPHDFGHKTLRKGEVITFRDGELTGIRWMDKRAVTVLSTIHDDEMVDVRCRTRQAVGGTEVVKKPNMIAQYNTYMGGVDKADQLLVYYGYSHFSKKWWKRVFFHLLDVTLVNAYLLVTPLHQQMPHLEFRLSVASGLIARSELSTNPIPLPPPPPPVRQSARSNPARLIGRDHFPEPTVGKQDCKVCSSRAVGGKRKRSAFQCNTCKVTLCVHPCFRSYHMKKHY